MKIFKKGDPVICEDYGIGIVTKVSNNPKNEYPVEVEFQSDNSKVLYTSDGRSIIGANITLQHSNHNWRP